MFLQIRRAVIPVTAASGVFTPDAPGLLPIRPILSVEGFIFAREFLTRAVLALSATRKFRNPF